MKNVSVSHQVVLSVVFLAFLSGCASHASRPLPTTNNQFVNQEMGSTIHSIQKSLQVLVDLERGDEGPRKTTALGPTIAGAATANRAPVSMPSVASTQTALGQARISENRFQTNRDLDTRVRLNWTGKADELLGALSQKVGFSFVVTGTSNIVPVVYVNQDNTTVKEVLKNLATQVDSVADIRVDTASRRVTLAYRSR